MLEVYGQVGCPFSWRVRYAAHEKGVPVQWIPVNVPHPDPRVQKNDPQHRSPLVVDVEAGLTLVESLVIEQYIDEAFPGRALQAASPQDRAQGRMLWVSFDALSAVIHGASDEASLTRLLESYAGVERALAASGRPWLLGEAPGLTDIALLPLLSTLDRQGHKLAPRFAALAAYWSRGRAHDGFLRTSPAAVRMEVGA